MTIAGVYTRFAAWDRSTGTDCNNGSPDYKSACDTVKGTMCTFDIKISTNTASRRVLSAVSALRAGRAATRAAGNKHVSSTLSLEFCVPHDCNSADATALESEFQTAVCSGVSNCTVSLSCGLA
jgi:hypothetical protein